SVREAFVVGDRLLEPDAARVDRNRVIDDWPRLFRPHEDVYEVDVAGHIAQTFVGRLAEHPIRGKASPMHRHDLVVAPCKYDAMRYATRSVRESSPTTAIVLASFSACSAASIHPLCRMEACPREVGLAVAVLPSHTPIV